MTVSYQAEREQVALACRMLAMEGLAETTLGHVSLRVDDRHFLVRARRASEHGLLFTTADDIALTDLDGNLHPGEPPISLPAELPIHSALLAARPECAAVVHAHSPAVVACTVTGMPLRPIVGAYNIPAARLATDGIPTYHFSGLIRTAERADGLVGAIGDRPVCLLRGHGLATAGTSLSEAVLHAIDVHILAGLTVTCAQMQRPLIEIGAGGRRRRWHRRRPRSSGTRTRVMASTATTGLASCPTLPPMPGPTRSAGSATISCHSRPTLPSPDRAGSARGTCQEERRYRGGGEGAKTSVIPAAQASSYLLPGLRSVIRPA